MEERHNLHSCGICGSELPEDKNKNRSMCKRCEDAWEREVECDW